MNKQHKTQKKQKSTRTKVQEQKYKTGSKQPLIVNKETKNIESIIH
jgi:hypothetical protein